MENFWAKIKAKVAEIWAWFVAWVLSRSVGQIVRIFVGVLVAAFFAIVFKATEVLIATFVVAVVVELLDLYKGGVVNWKDVKYMMIGALPIEVYVIIAAFLL